MRVVSVLLLKITEGNPRNHVCGFQELLLFMHDGITQCNRWHDRSLQWHTTWLGKNVHEWVATNWFTRLATIATALSAARCHTCNGNVCGFLLFFSWSSVARVLGKTVYGSNSRRCSGRSATERGGLHKFAKMRLRWALCAFRDGQCKGRTSVKGPIRKAFTKKVVRPPIMKIAASTAQCVWFSNLVKCSFCNRNKFCQSNMCKPLAGSLVHQGWCAGFAVSCEHHGLAKWLWFIFLFFWFVEVL